MRKLVMFMFCGLLISPLGFAKENKGFKYKDSRGKVQYCKGEIQCSDPSGKHCECLQDLELYEQLKAEEKKEQSKAKKNK